MPRAAAVAAIAFCTWCVAMPARATGSSVSATSGRDRASRAEDDEPPVENRDRSATLRQRVSDRGMERVDGEQERPPGRPLPHRQDARVIGVQHDPPVGARDPRDGRLDLCELIQRLDTVEPEMVARDIGDDGDVVLHRADPSQEDATSRRLQDRYLDSGLRERDPCTREA